MTKQALKYKPKGRPKKRRKDHILRVKEQALLVTLQSF